MKKYNPLKLKYRWSKREKDFKSIYPGQKRDAAYIFSLFSDHVMDELKTRGYDLKTIKFEISRSEDHPNELCRKAAYKLEEYLKHIDGFMFVEAVIYEGGNCNKLIIHLNKEIEKEFVDFEKYPVEYKVI